VRDGELRLPLARVKRDLQRFGLMPVTDPEAPSLVSIVAGGPISGSWWGHPAGQLIYQVSEALDSEPDVLVIKLWRGKLTLIHRRLWPALVRIGRARATWQNEGLGKVALRLLARIERENTLRSDHLPTDFPLGYQGFRSALRDLDQRLLVLTRSVHTSTGAHALEAESWAAWCARVRVTRLLGSVASAQLALEVAARHLAPGVDHSRLFPWSQFQARLSSVKR